jgi:hypothetical protein
MYYQLAGNSSWVPLQESRDVQRQVSRHGQRMHVERGEVTQRIFAADTLECSEPPHIDEVSVPRSGVGPGEYGQQLLALDGVVEHVLLARLLSMRRAQIKG